MTNPFIQFHLCDFNMATDYCCAWDNYQAMEQFNNSLSLRAPMWYNVFETPSAWSMWCMLQAVQQKNSNL